MWVTCRRCLAEVVPPAVVGLPVEKIIGWRADISRGTDDLDYFEGASFKLDDKIEIAVRHYRGHPKDTTTIYIDRRENDVEHITQLIRRIFDELRIPLAALPRERRDNPEFQGVYSFYRCL
jgi:hypothetical protein